MSQAFAKRSSIGGSTLRISSKELQHGKSAHFKFVVGWVTSTTFDTAVCLLIVLNSASIGVQTDYVATNVTTTVPSIWRACEATFCALFVVELMLRLYVYRCSFFWVQGRGWNIFDLVVVGLQLIEEIGAAIVGSDTIPGGGFSFVRILRILRIIRVVRLIRILRLITELRTLVSSILTSMKSLFWTVVLLALMVYTISLYLTQLVADHRIEQEGRVDPDLVSYYGTLPRTMLSMFQAITGGVDWALILEPLIDNITPWSAVVFTLYIAFSLLAMLNVVTGVFVESVLKSTKADKDLFLVNNARELFQNNDGSIQAAMTWDIFESKLGAPPMREFFRAIEVDPSEAKHLFALLDLDESGTVSADEFLSGCLRLRGPARSLDVALLIQDVKGLKRRLRRPDGKIIGPPEVDRHPLSPDSP